MSIQTVRDSATKRDMYFRDLIIRLTVLLLLVSGGVGTMSGRQWDNGGKVHPRTAAQSPIGRHGAQVELSSGPVRRSTTSLSTICAGVQDTFQCSAEPASPSFPLRRWLTQRAGCNSTLDFDDVPGTVRCETATNVPSGGWFGHTVTFPIPSCAVKSAHLRIGLKAGSVGATASDVIEFLENSFFECGSLIKSLPEAGGTWSHGQSATIDLDLGSLPAGFGKSTILSNLSDGDLDIVVANQTGVDFICLDLVLEDSLCRAPVSPWLVGWWTADGSALDLTDHRNDGLIRRGGGFTVGKVDNGFVFDADTEFVEISDPSDGILDFGSESFSMEAWIKTTSADTVTILDKRSSPLTGYAVFIQAGKFGLELGDGLVSGRHVAASPLVNDGAWHHVAATIDQALGAGRLYIDGVIRLTFDPSSVSGSISNDGPLRLGQSQSFAPMVSFNGMIDEVSLYSASLDSSDVQAIFVSGGSGKVKPSCSPIDVTVESFINRGWNLMSVPLQGIGATPDDLFPERSSNAFGYNNGYFSKDSLRPLEGFWIKFPWYLYGTGKARLECERTEFQLSEGWNLVGGPTWRILSDSLTTSPAGIIAGRFFEYKGGYAIAPVLNPWQGYWVKATAAGTVTITLEGAMPKGQVTTSAEESFPDLNAVLFSDTNGNRQVLLVGKKSAQSIATTSTELPPVPPVGAFDVRFETNRFAEVYDEASGPSHQFVVNVAPVNYPLRVELTHASDPATRISIGGKFLREGGVMEISHMSGSSLTLLVEDGAGIPTSHRLAQNFPNPFNPTSMINFDVAQNSQVTLKVYDLLGRVVATLIDNEQYNAGRHQSEFDGAALATGVYFYRITVQSQGTNFSDVKKMLLMK